MAEKYLDDSEELAYLPVASPPRNHGHTTAAWVTVTLVMVGAVVAALGVMFAVAWLFWVGMAVIVIGGIVGRVLKMLGFGQPAPDTRDDRRRDDAHR